MDDMKQFSIPGSPDRDDTEKQKLIEKLRTDTYLHRVMKTKGIPDAELAKHAFLFKRFLASLEPCRGCRSLKDCRQKQKGYHMGLSYDVILQETVEACPYEADRLKKEAQMERYLVCDFGNALRSVRFEEISLEGETSAYLNAVGKLASLCDQRAGVFLYGNMGTGKTYLAACASNRIAESGGTAAFIHYPSFCDRIAVTAYSGEYRKEADQCRAADILVIDDIGAEEVTDRNRMVLLSILDGRMQKGKMTWFTGNGDLRSLQSHFRTTHSGDSVSAADRIMERIKALAQPVYLDGNDRRTLYEAE